MKEDTGTPTLKGVADASGMSVASVSKVLNNRGGVSDEGRRRIMEGARRLGYHRRAERTLRLAGVERAMLAAGHREIMHVTLPKRPSLCRRMEGFKVAMEEAGLGFDPDRHLRDLSAWARDESETQIAVQNAIKEGRLEKPTALFCSTDVVALGVLRALQEMGMSAPGDYSIIGVDDISIAAHCNPPLTTMRIDRAELGRLGTQMLLERIADASTAVKRINIGVELIERSSVGPPREGPSGSTR